MQVNFQGIEATLAFYYVRYINNLLWNKKFNVLCHDFFLAMNMRACCCVELSINAIVFVRNFFKVKNMKLYMYMSCTRMKDSMDSAQEIYRSNIQVGRFFSNR